MPDNPQDKKLENTGAFSNATTGGHDVDSSSMRGFHSGTPAQQTNHPRPDLDSSSMRGYHAGNPEFKPN